MENTKIAWADHTFNPWIGCAKVHTGCLNCYAEVQAGRFGVTWGPDGTRRKTSEAYWRKPLAWNRLAEKSGVRFRVFPSLCDPFEDWDGPIVDHHGKRLAVDGRLYIPGKNVIPPGPSRWATMSDLRRDFFRLIDKTPNLDWLLLTKRPENIRRMWPTDDHIPGMEGIQSYMRNVHLLYSASDQETLEAGLPHLLACRDLVPVLGVSLEPLVGPVDVTPYIGGRSYRCRCGYHRTENELVFFGGDEWACPACAGLCVIGPTIDWVIVGGESGWNARPCSIEDIESVVEQCQSANVRCFVKQDRGRLPGQQGQISDRLWNVKEFP